MNTTPTLGQDSTSDSPQQNELRRAMERIDNKIKGKILAEPPQHHRHYNAHLHKNPIAAIKVPNSIYYDWDEKIMLQTKLHPGKVAFSYTDLLNFSLARTGMFLSVKNNITDRLKKESNKIKKKYTTLKGGNAKATFKLGFHQYLLFESELCFYSQAPPCLQIPGLPYHKVKPSTQQKKIALIKIQAMEYLKGLDSIGLKPKLLTLEHDGGESIHIKLGGTSHCLVTKRNVDEDTKRTLLHSLMTNNVSFKIYHEIASLFPQLPRAHEMKKLRDSIEILQVESTNHNGIEGAECDFVKLLTETAQNLINGDPTKFRDKKIRVKVSLDGAKYSRTSNFCILSFTVLGGDDFSQSNVHVLSVIKAAENYNNIAEGMKGPLDKINRLLRDPHIIINEDVYDIELFLCSDYKMILLLMGLKKATSKYACVWCKVEQDHRWDTGVKDSEYIITKRRTLKSLFDDYEKQEHCCKHLPLLNIEIDHIIPDELHILLRITDVLLKNLIKTAVASDKKTMTTRWKLKKGPMTNSVILCIRRCGIPFDIWEKNDEDAQKSSYSFTSLVGYRKKNLLKYFPSKIPQCHPPARASEVQQLWKDFKDIYDIISQKNPMIKYEILHQQAKDWVKSYTKLRIVHTSYRPQYVTPYMHILMYHVPHLIDSYGNIKQFSCQAVEKKNDICKSIYFKSSNKKNPTKDIINHEQRVNKLRCLARRKRKYIMTKSSSQAKRRKTV